MSNNTVGLLDLNSLRDLVSPSEPRSGVNGFAKTRAGRSRRSPHGAKRRNSSGSVARRRQNWAAMRSQSNARSQNDLEQTADKESFAREMGTTMEDLEALELELQSTEADDSQYAEAFQMFDMDGNGTVDASELPQVLTFLKEDVDPKEADKMIREADSNNDGLINYDEFIALMRARKRVRIIAQRMQEQRGQARRRPAAPCLLGKSGRARLWPDRPDGRRRRRHRQRYRLPARSCHPGRRRSGRCRSPHHQGGTRTAVGRRYPVR